MADRATPAVAIEVGSSDGPVWTDAVGTLTYEAGAPRATRDTIFDLASLTKVIVTASLAMRHFTAGTMHAGMRVGEIFPDWESDPAHAAITVRHLLDHSSGLPAHARFWEQHRGRRAFLDAIYRSPLERPAGAASVYSDLGFMMLGFLIEHARHQSLDEQFAMLGFSEDGDLEYRPPRDLAARIAPSECDPWRGHLLVGEVHDENCAALDGVAGHAGLFGTAPAVGRFAALVLRTFTRETTLGAPEVMKTFATATGVPDSSRALAWDTMRPTSSCGTRASAAAIGHTGFTGTSLWIDPEKDRYVVLLSNRVHPARDNQKFPAMRAAIHDAVDQDLEARSL